MAKKHIAVEVITEGNERFLLKTYVDGTKERVAIVRERPKKGRLSSKIAWYRDLRTGRKILY
jgi:hypothetical protein